MKTIQIQNLVQQTSAQPVPKIPKKGFKEHYCSMYVVHSFLLTFSVCNICDEVWETERVQTLLKQDKILVHSTELTPGYGFTEHRDT